MTQQSQVASPNETEQESPSAGNVEKKSQAAASSETDHDSATADTRSTSCMSKLLSFLIWAVIILGVIVLWLAFLHLTISSANFAWNDLSMLGQLGDSFGTLNTLFSGLAFLGIIISIKLQRDDLKLQREELAMQRKEITFQRKAIEIQAQEAKHQSEEMESQRRLAQEYQDERFFVLLLEQIKGIRITPEKEYIIRIVDECFSSGEYAFPTVEEKEYRIECINLINNSYVGELKCRDYDKLDAVINSFLGKVMKISDRKYQIFFDMIVQIYEFVMSISDEKIRNKYAKIVYNSLDKNYRFFIYLYMVAQLKLRKGDVFCDLLYSDCKKSGKI